MAMVSLTTPCAMLKAQTHYLAVRDLSAKITEAERDIAIARLDVYRKWVSQEVMQVEKHDSIVIIPIENISPRYRDDAT